MWKKGEMEEKNAFFHHVTKAFYGGWQLREAKSRHQVWSSQSYLFAGDGTPDWHSIIQLMKGIWV